MKYRYAIILFSVAFILQATLLNLFAIMSITPNLILCLVVALSFLYEDSYCGVMLGVVFGLLSDLCFSQYLGIAAMGYFLTGLGAIFIREVLNKENIVSMFFVSAGATLFYNMFYWLIMAAFDSNYSILYCLKMQPISVIFNCIIVAILYMALIKRVVKYHFDKYYK